MIGAYWRRQEDAAKLRESNEAKDRLLASVSHEIRTPLAAVVGLSEEIAAGGEGLGREELLELNGIIATQSRELAELVEDLLVASRADSGDLSVRREPVDLVLQVESVMNGVSGFRSGQKSVVLEEGEAEAWGDPLRVRQVVRNLITNAIKYGGDEIVVSVENSGETARVRVADNGEGIPPEEAELIFERYYRSSHAPSPAGSMGIGLSLARRLAELMGGTVEYVPDNGWHSFVLSLPAIVSAQDGARQVVSAG
jgi:signal transduction histidine kinase